MPYSFVPAAISYSKTAGLGIYVKYQNAKSDKVHVKHLDPNYIWLVCPDRELVIVKDAHHLESFRPVGENFDEFIDLNIATEAACLALECGCWMPNYFAHLGKGIPSPMLRRNGVGPTSYKPKILADSGGFQLFMGVVEYLDPIEIVKWYNDNVDWGMVLDIPPMVKDESILLRSAKVQKDNNDLMLDNSAPHLELINIVHGFSIANKQAFHDIVFDPKIDRMAIAGYHGTTVSAVAELLSFMYLDKGDHYKHFHMLGVYKVQQMAALIKVGNLTDKLVTSDASTHIQSALHKTYHHQQSLTSPARRLIIGDKVSVPESMKVLPCCCPVCSSLKYLDILSVLDSTTICTLLSLHNLYEIMRYSKMMDSLCRDVSTREYKAILKAQLGVNNVIDTFRAIDLAEACADKGYAYAADRYRIFLKGDGGIKFKQTMNELPLSRMDEDELSAKEQFKVDFAEALKTSDAVLTRYESREIVLKHGKKSKRKERNATQTTGGPKCAGKTADAGLKKRKKKSKKDKDKAKLKSKAELAKKEKANEQGPEASPAHSPS